MIAGLTAHGRLERLALRRRLGARRGLPHGRARASALEIGAHPDAGDGQSRPAAVSRARSPKGRASSSRTCRTTRRPGASIRSRSRHIAGEDITAIVIQQPNFFGAARGRGRAHRLGARERRAGHRGRESDVARAPQAAGRVGRRTAPTSPAATASRFGVPLSSGGPYVGFMACRMEHVRQMPGRIVGRTVDTRGQARLHADAAGARAAHPPRQGDVEHLHQPGTAGDGRDDLPRAARARRALRASRAPASRARNELVAALAQLPGVRAAFAGPRFHEAVLKLDRPVAPVLEALAARGIIGGFDLSRDYPELGNALLVCATETRTQRRHRDVRARARPGARPAERRPDAWRCAKPEKLIFEHSRPGRGATAQYPAAEPGDGARRIPARGSRRRCPRCRELQAVRHYTRLSQLNFSHRHALLSARLLHDEVQPAGLQLARDAAGVPRPASARAGVARARASSPACSSCRRC